MRVQIKDEKCLPYKKHTYDAGFDLKSNEEDITIKPGEKVKIGTGVHVEIPKRHVGIILPRSGLGTAYEVQLANTAGVIDCGYTGEVIAWVVNRGKENVIIKKYDRFCQLLVIPCLITNLTVIEKLPETDRGISGFGASGVSNG